MVSNAPFAIATVPPSVTPPESSSVPWVSETGPVKLVNALDTMSVALPDFTSAALPESVVPMVQEDPDNVRVPLETLQPEPVNVRFPTATDPESATVAPLPEKTASLPFDQATRAPVPLAFVLQFVAEVLQIPVPDCRPTVGSVSQ